MKSLTNTIQEGMRQYNRNPLNEEELFALGTFFMEFGDDKAISFIEKEYNNDEVTKNFKSALKKIDLVGDGND